MTSADFPLALNPSYFRDDYAEACGDVGTINVVFIMDFSKEIGLPATLPYYIDRHGFTVDCTQVKNVWKDTFREDIINAIDNEFGYGKLRRHELNLIGL